MTRTSAIIIGAGQFGLAMSRALSMRSIDHVVLDRGSAGEAWRSERWDSLRLLTPNWANGLPGAPYDGEEPHGFMPASEMAERLQRYASDISAPLRTGTQVIACRFDGAMYHLKTTQGDFTSPSVVIATGAASQPHVPDLAKDVPPGILQVTPDRYRRPSDLPEGRVLVVGAAATGVQLARELHLSGRPVTLAVGSHVRLPRTYRGKDIEHWLTVTGILDQTIEEIDDVERARRLPAPQLIGGGAIDLNTLQSDGVEIVGRLQGIRDGHAQFSGGLAHVIAAADLKMNRTLNLADDWIEEHETGSVPAPDRSEPTRVPQVPRLSIDLSREPIRTVLWATGFQPDFSWLNVPIFDARGRLRHSGGVCESPGLYAIGLPITRRRRSHHISGTDADSRELADHLERFLTSQQAA